MWNWFRAGKESRIHLTAQAVPEPKDLTTDRKSEMRLFIHAHFQLADITERADSDRYI